ncbi:nuclease P1-like [Nymphaea colorata]|uniref:nuclease P1-like n=1 Tax=Nymphaea colorata TaxID=210225 RepID=UPI00129DF6A8|nr:nuclease P1-like [Nymphaea colorata]
MHSLSPYVEDTVNPVINYTESAVNSIEIMKVASKVLRTNINKTTAERALFARYLVHLVGDIHQPLHSVALFNESFPKGDVGGNFLKVVLKNGSTSNFHSYWDAGGYLLQNDSWVMVRPLKMQNLTALKEVASQLVNQYGKEESFLIAQNTTYPYVATTNKLNDEYIHLTYETSKKRITLAGFRLANYIKDIYKSIAKTAPTESDNMTPH